VPEGRYFLEGKGKFQSFFGVFSREKEKLLEFWESLDQRLTCQVLDIL
jgi:hypothetical protein